MGDKGDGSLPNLESDKSQFPYQFGDGGMGDTGDGSLANLESDKSQFLYQFGDGGMEDKGMIRWLT